MFLLFQNAHFYKNDIQIQDPTMNNQLSYINTILWTTQ